MYNLSLICTHALLSTRSISPEAAAKYTTAHNQVQVTLVASAVQDGQVQIYCWPLHTLLSPYFFFFFQNVTVEIKQKS